MSFDDSKWVWMNGRAIPWQNATTHVSAHALHYGSAVFEGMRCYETADGPAVFRMNEHLDRLERSAAIHGMTIPFEQQELSTTGPAELRHLVGRLVAASRDKDGLLHGAATPRLMQAYAAGR